MRKLARTAVLAAALIAATATATPAFAGTVTHPSSSPVLVPANGAGTPYSFTVRASGFEPGANVYIEQCDGSSPSSVFWDPTLNCDLGTSPAAAVADASGTVSFGSGDVNHRFVPFRGTSPQALFDCVGPQDPPSTTGNPSFNNCQVRLSTSNSTVTSDQVFFALRLPNATVQLSCVANGSFGFNKPITNVIPTKPNGTPKPLKAVKIKGAANLGTAAGTACTNTNQPVLATKYPVTSGTVKFKGAFPAGTNCSVLSNPEFAGTVAKVKWKGINPKNGKLSPAGKSDVALSGGTVATLPTGGWVVSGTVIIGNFIGSTVRMQLAVDGAISGETNGCNAGSLAGVGFTGVMSASSITVL